MSAAIESSDKDNIHEEVFKYHDWIITTRKSHILQSKCVSPFVCDKTKERSLDGIDGGDGGHGVDLDRVCMFCRYSSILSMPHMPDMTYANNWLIIEHKMGFALKWNCLEALQTVAKELPKHIKVGVSEDWLKARSECEFSKVFKKAFDWTFTTDYMGSVVDNGDGVGFRCETSDERIDIEKLKAKDEILFYDDVHLFEDELADHGVSQLSVKIRVMKNSFFILLRYFLRIDSVLIRMNDTRLYHEIGTNYILREFTSKESYVKDLTVPSPVLTDPVAINNHLQPLEAIYQKLIFKTN